MYFIDVILPIPLKQTFTYVVNKDEAAFLKQGIRVAVPFGKNKIYTALVYRIHQEVPSMYEAKSIDQILDEEPIITTRQLQHWEWMASYYMCSLGEVMRAAFPSAFLLESETLIKLESKTAVDDSKLSDDEFLIYEALTHQGSLHINDVRNLLDRKNVVKAVNALLEKNLVHVEEKLYEQYIPRIRRYVKLAAEYSSETALKELLDSMARAPKQKEVLMTLFMLSAREKAPIESLVLQKESNSTSSVLKKLIEKGILEAYFIRKDRLQFDDIDAATIPELSTVQQTAIGLVEDSWKDHNITLLHGITSSGKTEIYIELISRVLKAGKQVLYMVPEIALTTQLIGRLRKYFPDVVSVYHSKYSTHERVEVWNNVLKKQSRAQLIIGARSSLFLPFDQLGLIVVDEEHEPSFKQFSPAPRYHGRDAAIYLAGLHDAKTILGSATPALESYYNARNGKYGLVSLTERYGDVTPPNIELVDLRDKYKRKLMSGHFSDRLLTEIKATLADNEQIILFQNRRGFAPIVECTTCGVSPQCPNCDVSLTYHQFKSELRCHYCGYRMAMLTECLACGSETLDNKGFGTEQIEEELKSLFPDKRVARMDQDTTRKKHAYAKIIDQLDNHEIDILVGTQMLAKGLDFRNVNLVGVLNADNLLNFPDFRAHERSFQLLLQVSGRAGRTQKQGKVLIQTFNPFHPILQQVVNSDYEGMYELQLEERNNFKYPPFYRTIKITFRDRNYEKMTKAATWFGLALRQQLDNKVLGPEPPPIGRIRNLYISNILIKIPRDQSISGVKRYILEIKGRFDTHKIFSSVKLTIDVDNH